ncbi:MAG: peptide chain release factor 2 [Deltaproteobacteria bacterium]|nr:MAG: peptide chain release factor 2 [Deltaproteobacteria bacterium]
MFHKGSVSSERNKTSLGGVFDLPLKRQELHTLEAKAAAPDLWDDQDNAQKVLQQRATLEEFVQRFDTITQTVEDVEAFLELSEAADDEEEIDESMLEEIDQELIKAESLISKIEFQRMLGGPVDKNNAIVSINSGAGGTESCDWASMLLRMIRAHCEKRGWKVVVNDLQDGDEAGIKSATLTVEGEFAYGYLKAEAGVHRLVRISPYDSSARRHTSFASVFVSPEMDDEIEIDIDEGDLRVDTYRASGAGGQHVNKTDSAIRITHNPTGIVVQCQNERSQHKNRSIAMKILRSRLYELEMQKQQEKVDAMNAQKKNIGWGSQIRSYVLHPYQMVKDLRTNHETSNVNAVLDGDLDAFIEAYLLEYGAADDAATSTLAAN